MKFRARWKHVWTGRPSSIDQVPPQCMSTISSFIHMRWVVWKRWLPNLGTQLGYLFGYLLKLQTSPIVCFEKKYSIHCVYLQPYKTNTSNQHQSYIALTFEFFKSSSKFHCIDEVSKNRTLSGLQIYLSRDWTWRHKNGRQTDVYK